MLLPRKLAVFFRQTNTPSEPVISSIAQDLIYNTTNGKSKTVKHVQLGLCTKRKTGYRKLITWPNRLGHSISYHDVNLVETHIAEEQIANVTTAVYVLNNITPEESVTFVYDNDNINVESVYGRSYHCTNAIAIQQKSNDRPEQAAAPATVKMRAPFYKQINIFNKAIYE